MKRTILLAAIFSVFLVISTDGLVFAQAAATPNLAGYFVEVGGQPTGPHDTAGLVELINQRQLTTNTLVWRAGLTDWVVAGAVEELTPLLALADPPPLPSTPPPLPAAQTPPPLPNQAPQATVQPGQTWYNSFAPGFENNRLFINAGIGFGPTGGYNMGIPPISVSVDFKVSEIFPITIGATGMFSTWRWRNPWNDVTYTNIGVGARAMYHFNFAENLDTYAGLTLGWVIQTASGQALQTVRGNSFFLWGGSIGLRYFFTDSTGVYSELGWSGLQYVSAGLTVKM
jgi:hypothetical protein